MSPYKKIGPGGRMTRLSLWLGMLLAVMVLLVVANIFSFEANQRALIETQTAINTEQQERILAVCGALATSREDLARALRALIEVSDADPDTVEDFTELSGLEHLEIPPPECDRAAEPLPGRGEPLPRRALFWWQP